MEARPHRLALVWDFAVEEGGSVVGPGAFAGWTERVVGRWQVAMGVRGGEGSVGRGVGVWEVGGGVGA